MQTANIVHGITGLILVTFVCLHIYRARSAARAPSRA